MTDEQRHTLRTFFAIEIEPDNIRLISQMIDQFKKHPKSNRVKWVPVNKIHVTLRFLGNVKIKEIPKICQAVSNELKTVEKFELEFQKVITFPSHHPRVVAIALNLSKPLAKVISTIEQGVNKLGFLPEQRPFLPHLTLGRMTVPLTFEFAELVAFPQNQHVTEIVFFESQLNPAGSLYVPIERFMLT
jgi:RNA 2',3'-cyclic 3'-phosphodiesterase